MNTFLEPPRVPRVFILDVDGVMTTGQFLYTAEGKAMKVLVNTCTVGVPFVKELEQAMAAQGVTVVDCPISGGPPGAERMGQGRQRSRQAIP